MVTLQYKKFFIFQIMLLIIIFIIVGLFIFFSKYHELNSLNQLLYNLQINKIKNQKFETIIIGDSTAGNAIDANYYSFLSSKKTGNLALTGSLSEAGLAILEKSSKEKLKNVIIMSDLDIWMRNPKSGYDFFIREYNNYDNFFYHYYKNLNLSDIIRISRMYLEKFIIKKKIISIHNDYIKQDIRIKNNIKYNFYSENLKVDKFKFIKKIFEYCKKEGIYCTHVNGPIIKRFCNNQNFKSYVNSIYKQFDLIKINYKKTILCLEDDEYGDDKSHIAPHKKILFTKKYFDILNLNN
jgi:hypothetical protein